jgi:AcrR family transcriptional regulator
MEEFSDNQKYQDILATAHRLFWKHGVRRVSVEEICREAGVSKMTFYRFFPNKVEVARTILDNLFREGMQKYADIMEEDIPYGEKIRKQLIEKFKASAEMSSEFVKDAFSDRLPELKEFWEEKANEAMQIVVADYKKAIEKGWLRKDIKLEFIIYFNKFMMDMILDEKLMEMYDGDMSKVIKEIVNLFFYGVLPRPENSNE